MKTKRFLNCLMLLLPFNALAHPGHEIGLTAAAAAGLSSGQLLSLLALFAGGLTLIAIQLRRRRKSSRADD